MKRLFKKNPDYYHNTRDYDCGCRIPELFRSHFLASQENAEATNGELANQELLDITSEDGAQETAGDIESQDQEVADGTVEGTPGEAVLTNGDVTGVVAEAKVTREQVRAKN